MCNQFTSDLADLNFSYDSHGGNPARFKYFEINKFTRNQSISQKFELKMPQRRDRRVFYDFAIERFFFVYVDGLRRGEMNLQSLTTRHNCRFEP